MDKVVVDLTRCKGHSQCEHIAPDIFEVRDGINGYQCMILKENPGEESHANLMEAINSCPTEALAFVN